MNLIEKAINEGIEKLNETILTYEELQQKAADYKDALEMSLTLLDDNLDGVKYNNAVKKLESIESRINYINFIKNEINNIKYFIKMEEKPDFNNHCLYFGTNSIYYSEEFLKLSSKEIFETILNHIFYYTGCLYIVINNEIKLSYVTTAFAICLGRKLDFKLGRKIYEKYSKDLDVKILNTNEHYRNFIIRNYKLMPFFKKIKNGLFLEKKDDISLTYRILLGNTITLQNMNIKISKPSIEYPNRQVSICNCSNDLFENGMFSLKVV